METPSLKSQSHFEALDTDDGISHTFEAKFKFPKRDVSSLPGFNKEIVI